jgi:hypothetical protein
MPPCIHDASPGFVSAMLLLYFSLTPRTRSSIPPDTHATPHHCYTCVLILLHVSSYYYMCPHTTTHVFSYNHTCVLILLHVSSYYYMCPHTTTCVSSSYCMCPHTTTYVCSSVVRLLWPVLCHALLRIERGGKRGRGVTDPPHRSIERSIDAHRKGSTQRSEREGGRGRRWCVCGGG